MENFIVSAFMGADTSAVLLRSAVTISLTQSGESVYAVVEKDMVVAQISFEDYLRTRREIANYAAYLFDNLLARQKRALLKPYPLEEGVEHYGINP